MATKRKTNTKRRRTVCWTRKSKKGTYVVCSKSRGQKSMRRRRSKRNKSNRKRGRK